MAFSVKRLGTTQNGGALLRVTDQSAANAALNETFNPGGNWRLVSASVAYSGVPTQAGVAFTLESGAGAAYNSQLYNGAANAQFTNWPDEASGFNASARGPLYGSDDGINVNAPAGGAAITAAVSLYIEVL